MFWAAAEFSVAAEFWEVVAYLCDFCDHQENFPYFHHLGKIDVVDVTVVLVDELDEIDVVDGEAVDPEMWSEFVQCGCYQIVTRMMKKTFVTNHMDYWALGEICYRT